MTNNTNSDYSQFTFLFSNDPKFQDIVRTIIKPVQNIDNGVNKNQRAGMSSADSNLQIILFYSICYC